MHPNLTPTPPTQETTMQNLLMAILVLGFVAVVLGVPVLIHLGLL